MYRAELRIASEYRRLVRVGVSPALARELAPGAAAARLLAAKRLRRLRRRTERQVDTPT